MGVENVRCYPFRLSETQRQFWFKRGGEEAWRFGVLFSGGFLLQHKGGWDSWEM